MWKKCGGTIPSPILANYRWVESDGCIVYDGGTIFADTARSHYDMLSVYNNRKGPPGWGGPKDLPMKEDTNRLAYLQKWFRLYSVDKTGNNICSMCIIIQQCFIIHYGFPDSLPLLRWEVKCVSCLAGMDPSMAA